MIINITLYCLGCTLGVIANPLPNILSCDLQHSCTAVDCCVDAYLLETSFNVIFNLDPCSKMMKIGIEMLQFDIPLEDYNFGE